jgi:hypothetical protein
MACALPWSTCLPWRVSPHWPPHPAWPLLPLVPGERHGRAGVAYPGSHGSPCPRGRAASSGHCWRGERCCRCWPAVLHLQLVSCSSSLRGPTPKIIVCVVPSPPPRRSSGWGLVGGFPFPKGPFICLVPFRSCSEWTQFLPRLWFLKTYFRTVFVLTVFHCSSMLPSLAGGGVFVLCGC